MAFESLQLAEARLQRTEPLTEQEVLDLLPWMSQFGTASFARLQAHISVGHVGAIRALNETSGTIEGAVRRMDEGSTKLGTQGLRLNRALFFWTIFGIVVSAVLALLAIGIAYKSYKAADLSSIEQQKTLESSRKSLESTVQSLKKLNEQLDAYQKQTLAKPEFTLDFWVLHHTVKPGNKFAQQSPPEISVAFDDSVILAPIIKNIRPIPAHNVRVLIGVNELIKDIAPAYSQIWHEIKSDDSGWRVFQVDQSDFYPGEWRGVVTITFKPYAVDGQPRMFVKLDSELSQHYEQYFIFRDSSRQAKK